MKSRIELLPAQRREVNERIKAAFKAGYNMGCESACLFNLTALNNLHGWEETGLKNQLDEVLKIADAAAKDPYMIDRMKIKMQSIGIEIQGRFDVEPPQYGE